MASAIIRGFLGLIVCPRRSMVCYPEISSPPSEGDRGEVGMEQRQTIPRLHEARPGEGGVDNQAEGDWSAHFRDSPRHERLREEGPKALVGLQGHGRGPIPEETGEEARRGDRP